jgi:hypothetical protein
MKTFSYLWHYLAEFFLGWEILQIVVDEKIKHSFYDLIFP